MIVPIMQFHRQGLPFCVVSWDESSGLVCDCGNDVCPHLQYVENVRQETGGRLAVLPNSDDVQREEMVALIDDPPRLREWMLQRIPVIDMDNSNWWMERTWNTN